MQAFLRNVTSASIDLVKFFKEIKEKESLAAESLSGANRLIRKGSTKPIGPIKVAPPPKWRCILIHTGWEIILGPREVFV